MRKIKTLLTIVFIFASVLLASAGTAQAHPRFFFGLRVAPPVVVAPAPIYPYPYPYPYPYYYPGYYYDPYAGYYYPRHYRLHRRHFRRFDRDFDRDWDRD